MRKRRKSHDLAVAPDGGADFGPALRLSRDGRLRPWGGAAQVVLETREDPSKPEQRQVVRGTRRRDALFDLEARRVITKRMFDAGEQFLEDCSIASGGSAGDAIGMPSVTGPRTGLPERQVNAITRINEVRHLLGLNEGTVFWWVLFSNGALNDYEKRHHLRNGTASGMLCNALDALDDHYNGSRRRKTG